MAAALPALGAQPALAGLLRGSRGRWRGPGRRADGLSPRGRVRQRQPPGHLGVPTALAGCGHPSGFAPARTPGQGGCGPCRGGRQWRPGGPASRSAGGLRSQRLVEPRPPTGSGGADGDRPGAQGQRRWGWGWGNRLGRVPTVRSPPPPGLAAVAADGGGICHAPVGLGPRHHRLGWPPVGGRKLRSRELAARPDRLQQRPRQGNGPGPWKPGRSGPPSPASPLDPLRSALQRLWQPLRRERRPGLPRQRGHQPLRAAGAGTRRRPMAP